MKDSLAVKRTEADNYRLKSDELEIKVSELATRLENQTQEVIRLQAELEEYEYNTHYNHTNDDKDNDDEEESEYEDFGGETNW